MTELRLLSSLPKEERESIENHVSRIPMGWDHRKMPYVRVPTIPPWTFRPGPECYSVPKTIEHVEFTVKKVYRGEYPYEGVMTALIANGNVIVQYWD